MDICSRRDERNFPVVYPPWRRTGATIMGAPFHYVDPPPQSSIFELIGYAGNTIYFDLLQTRAVSRRSSLGGEGRGPARHQENLRRVEQRQKHNFRWDVVSQKFTSNPVAQLS